MRTTVPRPPVIAASVAEDGGADARAIADPVRSLIVTPRPRRRSRRNPRRSVEEADRGLISATERRGLRVRLGLGMLELLLLVGLAVVGVGPLLWLAKAAITPTQDTLNDPMGLFPHGVDLHNLWSAWNDIHLSLYFWNTAVIAAGSWFSQLVVATTGGYLLSVLRPRYARVLNGMVLATLFVPAVVLLVPLYLTILDTPVGHVNLINTYWAVWLPAGANAFNVVLVKRFFDSLPREIFEAARVDGAGPFQLFRSIVLPMSRPILGVVSVFAILASWKDFLWPLLVITDPDKQPLSVRLPTLEGTTDMGTYLAALLLSTAFPILLFLVLQRVFLRSSALSGAVKG